MTKSTKKSTKKISSEGTPGKKQKGVSSKDVEKAILKDLATPKGMPSFSERWNLFLLKADPDKPLSGIAQKKLAKKKLILIGEDGTVTLTDKGKKLVKVVEHYWSIEPEKRIEILAKATPKKKAPVKKKAAKKKDAKKAEPEAEELTGDFEDLEAIEEPELEEGSDDELVLDELEEEGEESD